MYVAMTRARERLLLSGAVDFASWPRERPGAAPIAWLGPALAPDLPMLCAEAVRAAPGSGRLLLLLLLLLLRSSARAGPGLTVDGTDVPLRCRLNTPGTGDVNPSGGASDRELFAQARAGDEHAREQLVERYLPLARRLARRYQRSEEPLEDLVQVASLGLLKAVDRYDTTRETAFSSFAVPTILGELRRHFRDRTWSVRVPRELQELALRVDKTVAELSSERAGRRRWRDRRGDGRQRRAGAGRAAGRRGLSRGLAGRAAVGRRATIPRARASPTRSACEEGGFERAEERATLGADARAHHRARAPGADAAVRRGPDAGRDRRADRGLADAGLAADPPGARAVAGGRTAPRSSSVPSAVRIIGPRSPVALRRRSLLLISTGQRAPAESAGGSPTG